MADPNSKKITIILEGTTLFPETGKKRGRVFEERKPTAAEVEAAKQLAEERALAEKKASAALQATAQAMGITEQAAKKLNASLRRANERREKEAELQMRGQELSRGEAQELANRTKHTEDFNKVLNVQAIEQERVNKETEAFSAIGEAAPGGIGGMSSALGAANMSSIDFSGGIGSMTSKIAEMGK